MKPKRILFVDRVWNARVARFFREEANNKSIISSCGASTGNGGPVIMSWSGPTLASAGSDWKHFCGAPRMGDAEIFEDGHQVIMIEIMSDVKEQSPKG